MTDKEIINCNRLIDQFIPNSLFDGTDDYYLNTAKYHSSYDWLIPVYIRSKKIIKPKVVGCGVIDNTGFLAVKKSGELILEGNILSAYRKIIEAINWHKGDK